MEMKLICTLRPFDCEYCREDNRCGAHDEEICQYAVTETTAYLNDNASTFIYDPTIQNEVQAEGQRITKVLKYALSQIYKKEEEITEIVNMSTNHEFPKHIVEVLEYLKFEKKELRYYGMAQNYHIKDAVIEFGIDGDSLMCKDVTSMKPLFIVNSNIALGYFLGLLQAYNIIHGRYIYERVEAIAEEFSERLEDQR